MLLLAGLFLWWLLGFAVLLPGHSGVFNGSNGLQVDDHLQYMSFIRESGEHGLISNRFDVDADPRLFFHPLFFVQGLLWRLGLDIQTAFTVVQPLALVALFVAFAAYVRRLVGPSRTARLVALGLALFFLTPAMPLAGWLSDDPRLQFGTTVMGLEMFPAGYPWGGAAATLSIAMVPAFLLAAERLLDRAKRRPGRSGRWYAAWAGVAGLIASWLHPWQGMTILIIVGALVLWSRLDRRYLSLAVPVALTVAPLAYFFVLSRTDSSWADVSAPNDFPHVGAWLFLGLAPAALALPAFREGARDLQERALRIWPLAALGLYFFLQQSWFYHALAGLSLPLAILAVRSWPRLGLPRSLAVAAIVAVTVPGMVFVLQELRKTRDDHFLARDERRALSYLESRPGTGAVLAPQDLGVTVPGFTGRRTWVGHYYWTPEYGQRLERARELFAGRLGAGRARAVVRESRATFLLSGCSLGTDLRQPLGPMVRTVRRFGCATVYELQPRSAGGL
jgi:hypothetical protein